MQRSFIITNKNPFFINNFTSCKVSSLIYLFYLFAKTWQRSFCVDVVRSAELTHKFIGEVILLKIPSDGFLLMERVNSIVDNPYWQKLSSKWMILPLTIPKDLELEGFKQSQNAINPQKVKRGFKLSYLLDNRVVVLLWLEHFIDLWVFLSGNIEPILLLFVEDVEDGRRIERDKIVQIYVNFLWISLATHCWRIIIY